MSENSHTSPSSPGTPHPAVKSPLGALFGVLVPCGALLLAGIFLAAQTGPRWMEALAGGEPDPAFYRPQDALRVSRALLRPAAPASPALLWTARRSGPAAGFYLAGAARLETRRQPDAARLWLAFDALAHGRPAAAQDWMPAPPLPSPAELAQPGWLDHAPLGHRLKESLK